MGKFKKKLRGKIQGKVGGKDLGYFLKRIKLFIVIIIYCN
jgi:hypothetical protein